MKKLLLILAVLALLIYLDFRTTGFVRYYILGEGMPPGYCDPGPCDDLSPADWKTYRNEQYSFEFQYPKELRFDELLQKGPSDIVSLIDSTPGGFNLIVNAEKDFNKIIAGTHESAALSEEVGSVGLMERLGTQVHVDFTGDPPWGYYIVYIKYPNENRGLSFWGRIPNADTEQYGGKGEDLKLLKDILSTFKFTN